MLQHHLSRNVCTGCVSVNEIAVSFVMLLNQRLSANAEVIGIAKLTCLLDMQ